MSDESQNRRASGKPFPRTGRPYSAKSTRTPESEARGPSDVRVLSAMDTVNERGSPVSRIVPLRWCRVRQSLRPNRPQLGLDLHLSAEPQCALLDTHWSLELDRRLARSRLKPRHTWPHSFAPRRRTSFTFHASAKLHLCDSPRQAGTRHSHRADRAPVPRSSPPARYRRSDSSRTSRGKSATSYMSLTNFGG